MHAAELDALGSTLRLDLHKLQFLSLFNGTTSLSQSSGQDIEMMDNPAHIEGGLDDWREANLAIEKMTHPRLVAAVEYARSTMTQYLDKYPHEIKHLMGGLAFYSHIPDSHYSATFDDGPLWKNVKNQFMRDFCGLMGLSNESPLFTAILAGTIAIPRLERARTVMSNKRTEWTTNNELFSDTPLPDWMNFHPIFVCPISKEQATDSNWPALLPCLHIICKESAEGIISKTGTIKCPYCSTEAVPSEVTRVDFSQ